MEEVGELQCGVVEEMNIAFAWPEVREKLFPSLRLAIDFGDETTAGFIAAVIVSAYHTIHTPLAGKSRTEITDDHCERHRALWSHFNVV